MELISQADFARRKGVTRKTVTAWKREGRLVIVNGNIDVAASQRKLEDGSSHRATKARAPVTSKVVPRRKVTRASRVVDAEVTTVPAIYASGITYGNPANLPDRVLDMSTAIRGGASDLAFALAHHLPADTARGVVAAWVRKQRDGWVGGPGLPDAIADDCWPAPPLGYTRWSDHPLFTDPAVTEAEWVEATAEARRAA